MVERYYGQLIGYEMKSGECGDFVRYCDYAALECEIAELRAELNANPRWKPKAEELAVKLVAAEAENARLQNEWDNCDEMLQAARAENARLRALPLKDEVERLTYGQKLIAEAIEHHFGERTEDYDEDADDTTNRDAWEAFDALVSRLRAGEQEGWKLVPGDPDLAEHLIRAALVAGYKGVGSTDEEAETLADAKMADPKELAFSKAQYAGMLAAAPSDQGGDRG